MPKRSYSQINKEDNLYFNKRQREEPVIEEESEPVQEVLDILGGGDSVTVRDNHIYFYGKVSNSNCLKLNLALRDIEKRLNMVRMDLQVDNLKIYLHINSFGGSVFAALSTIDTIRNCLFPVVSIIEGAAASAATLMSVVCQERIIRKNAYMLIHQMSSGFWGKMEEIKDEMINLKKLTKKLKRIYREHTELNNSTSDVKLNQILTRDLWWDSDECLKYGLVDEIEH
jgi:ATP-dependent protease ClpP protease subunit